MSKRGRPTIGERRGIPTYTTLEPRHRKALEALAIQDDRTISNYLRKIIISHIKQKEMFSPNLDLGPILVDSGREEPK